METFICPRDWAHSTSRFVPTHLISLQNPGADVSALRPAWIEPENHHISFFYDVDAMDHPAAPQRDQIATLLVFLERHCAPGTTNRLVIHCDAGLGRSTATGYLAWAIFLGAGREQEAFERMVASSLETQLVPNTTVIAHADDLLQRQGALQKPLKQWNQRVHWRRTFR